jgi:3-methyladenine DNA glycosylase AlkD
MRIIYWQRIGVPTHYRLQIEQLCHRARTWKRLRLRTSRLKICEQLADDNNEMVANWLSWVLRGLVKREAGSGTRFGNQHESGLSK